jgi:hypothetical protein
MLNSNQSRRVVCGFSIPRDYAVGLYTLAAACQVLASGLCQLPCPVLSFPLFALALPSGTGRAFAAGHSVGVCGFTCQLPGAPYLVGALENLQLRDLCGQMCVDMCEN